MKILKVEPEFSRPLKVDRIPDEGSDRILNAKDTECAKLAQRFGILELKSLTAALHIAFASNGRFINVTGHLNADVVQECVVTLEPLPAHVHCEIDLQCLDEKDLDFGKSNLITPDDENIEPIVNGEIDLGEIVAQHLGAALDPYPRKPNLALVHAEYGGHVPAKAKPLARLVEIKDRLKD